MSMAVRAARAPTSGTCAATAHTTATTWVRRNNRNMGVRVSTDSLTRLNGWNASGSELKSESVPEATESEIVST